MPFGAAFEPRSRVNEHDDLIASDNELFRFASFGPVCARLRQVFHDSFVAMIRSASRKLGRLSPFDLRIEGFNGGRNVVAVECGVRSPEGFDFDRQGWRKRAEVEVFIFGCRRNGLRLKWRSNNRWQASWRLAYRDCIKRSIQAAVSDAGVKDGPALFRRSASCFHPIQINLQEAHRNGCATVAPRYANL